MIRVYVAVLNTICFGRLNKTGRHVGWTSCRLTMCDDAPLQRLFRWFDMTLGGTMAHFSAEYSYGYPANTVSVESGFNSDCQSLS